MRKFKKIINTLNFMGKIYPILVPYSIFQLKCMVKNNFKNVFGNTCCWWNKDYIAKKKCVFTVTRPTLIFPNDPMNFYTEFG
jgi:hypothetical protein